MPKRTSRSKHLPQSIEHGAASFGRWATTDHLHVADICKAKLGFRDTLFLVIVGLALRCLGLLGSLAVIYLMVIYGLPWFLFGTLP